MHGNVEEWCWDFYDSNYYINTDVKTDPKTDPKGPETGTYRVVRGGSFNDTYEYIRSAARWRYVPTQKNPTSGNIYGNALVGFRVVRNEPSDESSTKAVNKPSGTAKMKNARILPQGVRIEKNSATTPVKLQALRKKTVLE
jgi:formylglycine-generating enzyme required for sulfatase activity